MSEYTCCNCKITYKKTRNKDWSDAKAAEELLTLYPECKNHPTDILCDDCNEQFKKWFSSLTQQEKEKMLSEFNSR